MAQPTVQKNFRLPYGLAVQLENCSEESGKAQRDIVIKALKEYLEREDDKMLNLNNTVILSGEGEIGTYEMYEGKKTMSAIKSRLQKERAGGDRWAKAFAYSHDSDTGPVYTDIETGEQRHISEDDIG